MWESVIKVCMIISCDMTFCTLSFLFLIVDLITIRIRANRVIREQLEKRLREWYAPEINCGFMRTWFLIGFKLYYIWKIFKILVKWLNTLLIKCSSLKQHYIYNFKLSFRYIKKLIFIDFKNLDHYIWFVII